MTRPSHLTLDKRQSLLGRLLLVKATLPFRSELEAQGPGEVIREQLMGVVRLLDSGQTLTGTLPLLMDDYLGRLGQLVKARAEELRLILGDPEAAELARRIGVAFDAELSRQGCKGCGNGEPCRGEAPFSDDAKVADGGQCLGDLRALLAWARRAALDRYGPAAAAAGLGPDRLPATLLSTAHSPDPVHRLSNPSQVVGLTSFTTDPQGRPASVIKLVFQIEAMDWESFLAIPYVMLHECLVHAFQGARATEGLRVPAEAACPFTEGWLDRLAFEVLCDELDHPGPDWPLPGLTEDVRAASTTYHDSRLRPPANESFSVQRPFLRRRKGWFLAGRLGALFRQLAPEPDLGQTAFQTFSLGLNLYAPLPLSPPDPSLRFDAEVLDRDWLVARLEAMTTPSGCLPLPHHLARGLPEQLVRYMQDLDLTAFLEGLRASEPASKFI